MFVALKKMSFQHWNYIAGIWACFCFSVFILDVGPRALRLKNTIDMWAANNTQILEMQDWELLLDRLSLKEVALQQQLNALYLKIPQNDQMSIILACLQESSSDLHLSLRQIKTEIPIQFDTHLELPILVSAEGSFDAIGLFIDRIEKSPYLIKVNAVQIERNGRMDEQLKAVFNFHAIVVGR